MDFSYLDGIVTAIVSAIAAVVSIFATRRYERREDRLAESTVRRDTLEAANMQRDGAIVGFEKLQDRLERHLARTDQRVRECERRIDYLERLDAWHERRDAAREEAMKAAGVEFEFDEPRPNPPAPFPDLFAEESPDSGGPYV